ncbi:MAG: ribosomal protein S16 [Parcubacteria bacterium C7867-005]|nr:MAG: ribosomal protein S16 [Parcubacteria bacterium C7867-005]
MLKMRLQRVGRKHETAFRLVLTDSKNSTKSGRYKEILGSYDPRKKTDAFKADRIKHWLSQGIALTGSVHNLFVTHKIIDAKKINVLPKKTPIVKEVVAEEPKAEVKPVVEAPKEEAKAPEPVVEEAVASVEETPVIEEASAVETPAETPAEPAAEEVVQ